jgi:hypothetical protein
VIDDTPQESNNLSEQPRLPTQQVCASLRITRLLSSDFSYVGGLCCKPTLAVVIRCACIPDFDGESHTTDRQYIPAVPQAVAAATKSAAADLRFTPSFGNFSQRIVTYQRCTLHIETSYWYPEF